MQEQLIAFALACAILVAIPGPNVALIVATSIRYGFGRGIASSAGVALGIGTQLLLIVLGLTALIQIAAEMLGWITWLGVAYLIYLGIQTWRTPAADLSSIKADDSGKLRAFAHGYMIACINPKTLMFSVAFLPQFMVTGPDPAMQMAILSAILVTVGFVGDSIWALFASSLRGPLLRYGKLRNKITGGFLLGAGAALAIAQDGKP